MPPVACIHCATRVPFDSRSTDGRSRPLIDQSPPEATVRGSVHPFRVRSAKRSVVFEPACSIQLRRTPRFDTVNCASPVLAPAGEAVAEIVGVHAGVPRAPNRDAPIKCANSMPPTATTQRLPAVILRPVLMCSAPLLVTCPSPDLHRVGSAFPPPQPHTHRLSDA